MNKTYQIVEGKNGTLAVVSELAGSHRSPKSVRTVGIQLSLIAGACLAALFGLPSEAYALPVLPAGGAFFGSAAGSISTTGSTETVNITGNNANSVGGANNAAVINWSGGFDVASGNTVDFTSSATEVPT